MPKTQDAPEQKPTHPLLVQFDADLHAIAEKYRKQHPDWFFGYRSAYIAPIHPQKRDSITHNTEIVRPDTAK